MPERFLRVFDQSGSELFATHLPPGFGIGVRTIDEDTYEVRIGGIQVVQPEVGPPEAEGVAVEQVEVFKIARKGMTRPEWRFRAKAANGEVIAQSEGYRRRKDAADAAAALGPVVFV